MSFRSSLAATTLLATLAGPALAGTPYVLDPAHLSTLFVVDHMGYSKIYGRFGQVAGTVEFDPQAVETSSLSVTIKAASVDTNFGPRDDHLRSPDFFNVREFPDITFVSKKIEKTGERTGKVTGALTLLGVTRPVVRAKAPSMIELVMGRRNTSRAMATASHSPARVTLAGGARSLTDLPVACTRVVPSWMPAKMSTTRATVGSMQMMMSGL